MGGGGTKPINFDETPDLVSPKNDGKFFVYLDITCEDFPLVYQSSSHDGYKSKDTTKRPVPRRRARLPCLGVCHAVVRPPRSFANVEF